MNKLKRKIEHKDKRIRQAIIFNYYHNSRTIYQTVNMFLTLLRIRLSVVKNLFRPVNPLNLYTLTEGQKAGFFEKKGVI